MDPLLQRTRYLNVWMGCLPALLAFAAYTISAQHFESVKSTLSTDRFLGILSQLLSTVKDAETGQRGYLLTGRERYLKPYENALRVLDRQLSETETAALGNGVPPNQIRRMHELVVDKAVELRLTIHLYRTAGPTAALAEVETGRGQTYMDELRDLAREINERQRASLLMSLERQRRKQLLLEGVLAIGVVSGILTLYLSVRTNALYAEERDRAEKEIRRANENLESRVKLRTAELQRSNEDLLQFAYIASHDLQEPLRTVGSYIGLLSRRYISHLDETAQTYMQFAIDGASRMQSLINDLLQYSRAGTQALNRNPVPSEQIVRTALRNLEATIAETAAVVRYGDLPIVYADELKLAQVFQNLIGNGIKFHKPGEVPEVTISAKRESDEWVFTVSDNGVGFEEKYTDRIFQVFQRLHGVGKYPGNGIGLAISKRIVEHHDGRLWADSQPGEGSSFSFAIPGDLPLKGEGTALTGIAEKGPGKAVTNV